MTWVLMTALPPTSCDDSSNHLHFLSLYLKKKKDNGDYSTSGR